MLRGRNSCAQRPATAECKSWYSRHIAYVADVPLDAPVSGCRRSARCWEALPCCADLLGPDALQVNVRALIIAATHAFICTRLLGTTLPCCLRTSCRHVTGAMSCSSTAPLLAYLTQACVQQSRSILLGGQNAAAYSKFYDEGISSSRDREQVPSSLPGALARAVLARCTETAV